MLEGTASLSGSIGLGPSGMFESMIHATRSSLASGILLESGKRVTRCGRISSGNTDETRPRVHWQMRATAADITADTHVVHRVTPRRQRCDLWGGALRIQVPKHPKMLNVGYPTRSLPPRAVLRQLERLLARPRFAYGGFKFDVSGVNDPRREP